MKFDICPMCEKPGLEKMPVTPGLEWLEPPGLETWGCIYCENTFFKKKEDDTNEV